MPNMQHDEYLSKVFEMLIERLGNVEDGLRCIAHQSDASGLFLTELTTRWIQWFTEIDFACKRPNRANHPSIPQHFLNKCFVVTNPIDKMDILVIVRDSVIISYSSQKAFAQKLIDMGMKPPFLLVDRPLFLCNRENEGSGWADEYDWSAAMSNQDDEGCVIGIIVYTDDDNNTNMDAVQLVETFEVESEQTGNDLDEHIDRYHNDETSAHSYSRLKYILRWFRHESWICTKLGTMEFKPDPGYCVTIPKDRFESLERLWIRFRKDY